MNIDYCWYFNKVCFMLRKCGNKIITRNYNKAHRKFTSVMWWCTIKLICVIHKIWILICWYFCVVLANWTYFYAYLIFLNSDQTVIVLIWSPSVCLWLSKQVKAARTTMLYCMPSYYSPHVWSRALLNWGWR